MIKIGELILRLREPLVVRMRGGQIGLELFILDNAALFQVDQQHLARLQAPFAYDVLLGNWQCAAFAGEDDVIVLGHAIACRAQAIAVERRTDLTAIGKAHGRGAIPGLHQGCVIFVESALRRVHQIVLGPGFGDQHHHRMGEAVTACEQQLERIVEAGGVGLPMRDERPHLV